MRDTNRSSLSHHTSKFKTQTTPNTNEESDSLKQILMKAVVKSQKSQKHLPESIEERKNSDLNMKLVESINPDSLSNSINTYD